MPTPPQIDRRDPYEGDTIDLTRIQMTDPSRARTTISQRDITTMDLRDDALDRIWQGLADGTIDPLTIPQHLMDLIGLGWMLYVDKEVNVAAEQQAKILARQNAARVRIEVCCC